MVEIRPCRDGAEMQVALAQIWQYFGGEPTGEHVERFRRVLPLDRIHAAYDGTTAAGAAGAFPLELSVPGGSVACAAVTVVGVSPTHRRRGILTQLMRTQLDDFRERREPIAALWASEGPIYGRFGFGLASFGGEVEIPRDRSAFALPYAREGEARFLEVEEALDLFPPIYDAVREETPGLTSRSRDWWETRVLLDPEGRREGGGPHRRVLIDLDGEPAAYAIYRHFPKFEQGSSVGVVRVVEALGTTPAAVKSVWRYLLDIDWAASISASLLPVDHPLLLLLGEPRRIGFRLSDALWVRLVEVGAALSARSYTAAEPVVFEVSDAFCGWNEGRWRLEDGRAERTDGEPDLRLDVQALGSAYLGGITFRALERSGWVEELREGAIARADALFRTDVAPWCPEIF